MQQIHYDTRPGEFADAMKATRSARMVFWLILGLSIICQLAGFGLVEYGGVLGADVPTTRPSKPADDAAAKAPAKPAAAAKKPAPPAKPKPAAAAPEAPATRPTTRPALSPVQKWRIALGWALPVTKFTALVSAMLLSLTLLFAVNLSLIGRLGGGAGLISAFFWSLLLLAIVVPWQQVLRGSVLACGALFNLAELLVARTRWSRPEATWQDTAFYYGRFVAYPGAALLGWLVVHLKFNRACLRMDFPQAVSPPVAPAGPLPAAPAPAAEPAAPTEKPQAVAKPPAAGKPPVAKKPTQPTKDSVLGSVANRFFRARSDD